MGSLTRAPKMRKPVKGMRMFLKQGFNNAKAVIKSIIPRPKQWYYTHGETRSMWLARLRGNNTPHQGGQEKTRRVRQMRQHKCIDPSSWTYPDPTDDPAYKAWGADPL